MVITLQETQSFHHILENKTDVDASKFVYTNSKGSCLTILASQLGEFENVQQLNFVCSRPEILYYWINRNGQRIICLELSMYGSDGSECRRRSERSYNYISIRLMPRKHLFFDIWSFGRKFYRCTTMKAYK